MRVGLVTKWFASGQAVVSRQIRSALDELGHETFVLAKQGKGPRAQPERVDGPGLGPARASPTPREADIPEADYLAWARENAIDVVLCDQNDQFAEIGAAARAPACGRSAASSGRASRPRTPSRRARPTTSSTPSPAPSRSATAGSGSRARCWSGGVIPS